MENSILPSPSEVGGIDFQAESSRKRSSRATDDQGTISAPAYNFFYARESKLQRNSESIFGLNVPGNTRTLSCNQYPQSLESFNAWHQPENDQFCGQNDFALTWQTNNGTSHEGAVDKERNCSPTVTSQSQYSYDRGPLPLSKMSTGGILALSNQQPQEHGTFSKTEARKEMHSLPSFTTLAESEVGSLSGNLMSFGHSSQIPTDNFPLEVCKPQSDQFGPLKVLQQVNHKPDSLTLEMDAKASCQEATKSGIPCDMNQSDPSFNHPPIVGRAALGLTACMQDSENDRSLQSENAPSDIGIGDNFQDNNKGCGDENINVMKKTETIDIQNSKQSLTKGASPIHGYSPADIVVEHGQRDDQSHKSLKSDERSKLLPEKVAPTCTEKLWDGSLQLSSSVTVAALAFFKSGEKMPDVRWSEYVEVKGKVRLEAFEKYIQDLPRSRSRGLMVISLHWKEGSTKTGLAGMKEVAKGYKTGEKVGRAQLSPGVDLYICPHSDTIFTILAKHGFFKGMAAVEDNQDSLIGCVVWRRNNASSNSVENKCDRKNQSIAEPPLHFPSDSSTQRVAEKNSSHKQQAQKSSSTASSTDFATPESVGNSFTESKSMESSKFQPEACNSSTNSNSLLNPSVSGNCPSISVEAPLKHLSELQKLKASFEAQKPAMPLPSDVKVQPLPSPDFDDLPEFDFNSACGTPQAPLGKSLNAASLDVNQGMPLPKKAYLCVSDIPFMPRSEENHVSQSRATMTPATAPAFPPPKNRFDDGDDMPEWCFPHIQLQNQSLAESTRPSTTPTTSRIPNSTFDSLSHGPQRSLLPSPSSGAPHPSYCFQDFPLRYNYPTTITVKPAQPKPAVMQRDPNSSMGLNSNPTVMPPPHNPFDVKLPISSPSWRGWRPC